MKVETTIRGSYVPNWKVWEGIREIVQNMLDERDSGFDGGVRWRRGALEVWNDGPGMSRDCLLLGTSRKKNENARGKFGEGLKLGCLALVRAGVEVRIWTGREVWIPTIVKSRAFGVSVLAFEISRRKNGTEGTIVRIRLSKGAWNVLKDRFLPNVLNDGKEEGSSKLEKIGSGPAWAGDIYEVKDGSPGSLFVRGIWVQESGNLKYTYDLGDIAINRDRSMVDPTEATAMRAYIIKQCLIKGSMARSEVWELLERESDYEDLPKGHAAAQVFLEVPDEVRKAFRRDFEEMYGEKTIPVVSEAQARAAGNWGFRSAVVHLATMALVEGTTDLNSIIEGRMKGIKWKDIEHVKEDERFRIYDLIETMVKGLHKVQRQRSGSKGSCGFLGEGTIPYILNGRGREFGLRLRFFKGTCLDPSVRGMFFGKGIPEHCMTPAIMVEKGLPAAMVTKVLIHELAHFCCFHAGIPYEDGSPTHTEMMEFLWLYYSVGLEVQ